MTLFERNTRDFIRKQIREETVERKIGKISEVHTHTQPPDPGSQDSGDSSNFEVDVQIDGETDEKKHIPVLMSMANSIQVPLPGDKAILSYIGFDQPQPVVTDIVYTVDDRPPVGEPGMARDRYESGDSPAGSGDIYVTKYTEYDGVQELDDKSIMSPEETFVQIAKRKNEESNPSNESDLPAKIEFYDSPEKDASHIVVKLTKRDGSDSDSSWGMKFDLKTGEVTIADPKGYGLKSDGDGNWLWEYRSKNENRTTGGGSLSI